ncbi:hypothetical protein C8J57DRAFT_1472345 [Mycena rebaudengoi]|nr:hypothetical protein C8J57DRAFT_1472345 [Mycena rebaudengoi]
MPFFDNSRGAAFTDCTFNEVGGDVNSNRPTRRRLDGTEYYARNTHQQKSDLYRRHDAQHREPQAPPESVSPILDWMLSLSRASPSSHSSPYSPSPPQSYAESYSHPSISPGSACDVCLEQFGADHKAPCSIPCGHVFCVDCLDHLARPTCPLCRTSFELRDITKPTVPTAHTKDSLSAYDNPADRMSARETLRDPLDIIAYRMATPPYEPAKWARRDTGGVRNRTAPVVQLPDGRRVLDESVRRPENPPTTYLNRVHRWDRRGDASHMRGQASAPYEGGHHRAGDRTAKRDGWDRQSGGNEHGRSVYGPRRRYTPYEVQAESTEYRRDCSSNGRERGIRRGEREAERDERDAPGYAQNGWQPRLESHRDDRGPERDERGRRGSGSRAGWAAG